MDKLRAMMLFSFVFGGFALIAFATELYANVWGGDFIRPVFTAGRFAEPPNFIVPNFSSDTRIEAVRTARRQPPEMLRVVTSPASLMLLVTGAAFLANGLLLHSLQRKRDRVATRREVYDAVLTPDEKLAVKTLSDAGGELTQKDLALKAGLSAVKIHRVLVRLKAKGVVEQHPYGMTNKIMLK